MQLTLHSAQENSSQSIKCIDRKNCGRELLHKFSNNKNGAVAKMSIANSNKRGQRPSSLYYAVASRVTDVRAVCRMHSGKPEAASCEVERSGA